MSDPLPQRDAESVATRLIHHPYRPPDGFESPQVPVHKASTVIFKDTAAMRARDWRTKQGYTYGLHGTPTSFTLEERIATLEGGRHTVLAPSGLAAIVLVDLALLKSGDEVLIPDNAYGPGKELARQELAQWGIAHRFYDAMSPGALAAAIGPATKLVWVEAPGSVTMEFPDLRALLQCCRDRGVVSALDHTWGAGLAFCGFDIGPAADGTPLGADIVMHALTKYPSGGGDVLMGAVTTRDDRLHQRLLGTHMRLGMGSGSGNDAELVLRSLASLPLRYAAHDRSARALATWLGMQPQIAQVLHPAVPGSPGHEHWAALCRRAAGLFSVRFDPRYSVAQVDRFVDALARFRIGYSWGGPSSLVVPYQPVTMRSLGAPPPGVVVRFSIGLESADDLQADLAQALEELD